MLPRLAWNSLSSSGWTQTQFSCRSLRSAVITGLYHHIWRMVFECSPPRYYLFLLIRNIIELTFWYLIFQNVYHLKSWFCVRMETWYLSFWIWFISHGMMISSWIHFLSNVMLSLFFWLHKYYCLCLPHFLYLSICRWISRLVRFLALANSAATPCARLTFLFCFLFLCIALTLLELDL